MENFQDLKGYSAGLLLEELLSRGAIYNLKDDGGLVQNELYLGIKEDFKNEPSIHTFILGMQKERLVANAIDNLRQIDRLICEITQQEPKAGSPEMSQLIALHKAKTEILIVLDPINF